MLTGLLLMQHSSLVLRPGDGARRAGFAKAGPSHRIIILLNQIRTEVTELLIYHGHNELKTM